MDLTAITFDAVSVFRQPVAGLDLVAGMKAAKSQGAVVLAWSLLTKSWERRAYWTHQLELSLRCKSPQSAQLALNMWGDLDRQIVDLELRRSSMDIRKHLAETPRAKPPSRFRRRR